MGVLKWATYVFLPEDSSSRPFAENAYVWCPIFKNLTCAGLFKSLFWAAVAIIVSMIIAQLK